MGATFESAIVQLLMPGLQYKVRQFCEHYEHKNDMLENMLVGWLVWWLPRHMDDYKKTFSPSLTVVLESYFEHVLRSSPHDDAT